MTDAPSNPPKPGEGSGYADVRERLVAMGYLARPLERYVLGGVARPGSFLRRHAAVSLRVAVAAGPLLGLLFALAVVVANRPRFSHVRDFLVLAGGFTLVFGAAVFVLELAAGVLLGAFVRWRGRGVAAFPATAARMGFAVSLVLSAYLAFWWRRRAGPDAGMATDLAGLAVLVLVNAALLRVSSLASLAALVRVSDLPVVAPAANGEREDRSASGPLEATVARARGARLLVPAALAAILLIAGFFIAPRSRAADAPSPYTRIPVRGRMVVVAWDGIDPRHMERLLSREGDVLTEEQSRPSSAGAMTPARMVSWNWIGLHQPSPRSLTSPANLWTAVATGRSEHGVGSLEEERPVGLSAPVPGTVPLADLLRVLLPGRRMAVSARVRTAKTMWEILGNKEGVACVGWWATWPALARDEGRLPFDIVSDRALLALERPSAGRYLIAPPGLERRLNSEFEADIEAVRDEIASPVPDGLGDWLTSGRSSSDPNTQRRLQQSALIDGYALRVSRKLLADPSVLDLFLYLPGLDIAQAGSEKSSPPYSAFLSVYERWIHDRIEDLDAELTPGDRMIVLAFPGRAAPPLRETPQEWAWMVTREPRVAGSLRVLASEGMSILDIAPTLLNLRGFPVSREMEGRSLVFYADESQRPAPIDTYGRNTLPSIPFSSSSEENERETLERLRSLGYLN